jgi:cytidylate kinase
MMAGGPGAEGVANYDLVTFERQFGAGGSAVASALGRALGWPVFDRQILQAAAAQLHKRVADVAALDESALSGIEKVMSSFALATPETVALVSPDNVSEPIYERDPDTVADAVHQILRAAVQSPPLIIVGHGAQCLFRHRPRTLHVRAIASAEARARRAAERESIPLDDAPREVHDRDRQREQYLRHHFARLPDDSSLYGLQVNTDLLTEDECVAAIAGVVASR